MEKYSGYSIESLKAIILVFENLLKSIENS